MPPVLGVPATVHRRRIPPTIGRIRTTPPIISREAPMSTTSAVDPREAAFAINVGDPFVVDVDQHGAGWTIIAVYRDTYRVYRDEREMTVPHTAVTVSR